MRNDEVGADRPLAGEADLRGADRMSAQRSNERRTVRDIAHARAGDKGNTSKVNVWAYDGKDFDLLKRTLTPERIKREFPNLIQGKVERYIVEHLHGINIVMHDALEGGVNSSLNLDSHGKSWSYLILGLTLDEN
jgi:hypothetical protein